MISGSVVEREIGGGELGMISWPPTWINGAESRWAFIVIRGREGSKMSMMTDEEKEKYQRAEREKYLRGKEREREWMSRPLEPEGKSSEREGARNREYWDAWHKRYPNGRPSRNGDPEGV